MLKNINKTMIQIYHYKIYKYHLAKHIRFLMIKMIHRIIFTSISLSLS